MTRFANKYRLITSTMKTIKIEGDNAYVDATLDELIVIRNSLKFSN